MNLQQEKAIEKDQEHLKLLSIFQYVVAGMTALFSLFPLIHVAIGIAIIIGSDSMDSANGQPPPEIIGWIFAVIGGVIILCGLTLAICMFVAGRMLVSCRRYLFCLVIAGLECLVMPFGTVLGIFTIVVLSRESVKELFAGNQETAKTSN